MALRHPTVVLLLLSVLISACVTPAAREEAERTLGSAPAPPPSFQPLPSPASGAPATPDADPEPDPDDGPAVSPEAGDDEATAAPTPAGDPPPAEDPPGPVTVHVTDPRGDVQRPPLRDPPDYVDLLEVRLTATADVLEMLVTVGDDVPDRQERDDRTMNVALFLDVTGDGAIDHEVWTNLAESGWYPAHRDNRAQRARFGDETGIRVGPSGPTLRLAIPQELIGSPSSFRWVTATEWGDYASLGSELAARDRAPQDGPASFP